MLYSVTKRKEPTTVAGLATDDKFRDHLAENCREFRVLRDLAAAYKDGELINRKKNQLRLICCRERVSEIANQLGIVEGGDRAQGTVLMIELTEGQWLRASHASAPATSWTVLRTWRFELF